MGLLRAAKRSRFYQSNFANGELRKHWKAYALAGLLGYVTLSFCCGAAKPAESAAMPPSELEGCVEQSNLEILHRSYSF